MNSPRIRRSPTSVSPAAADFGVRSLLSVAVPLMVSVACFSLTLFTDRMLLLSYDPLASGAAISAGNLYWTFACLPVTAMGFVTPLIAQTCGRGGAQAEGRRVQLIWQSVWVTATAAPLFLILAAAARLLFDWSGHSAPLAASEAVYFRLLLMAAPASMLEAGLSAYFVGQRVTRPVMRVNLATACLNVVLDYWFIFGGLGLPALGIAGAALATVAAMWFKAGVYAYCLVRDPGFRRESRRVWAPSRRTIWRIVAPGSTLGLQQLVRSFAFSAILLAIGAASATGLAASSVALSIYQLLAIPLIGLASAVTVLVGQAIAAGGAPLAKTPVNSGLAVGGCYAACVAALMVLLHEPILTLAMSGMEDAKAASISTTATRVLKLAAVYCLADTALLLLGAGLKGMGRTLVVFSSTLVASVLWIGLGWVWQVTPAEAVLWWWSVLIGWAACQALWLTIAMRRQLGRSSECAAPAAAS